jgi:hypothetical protein
LFCLFKGASTKTLVGELNSILLVLALAAGWHVGVTWLVRSRGSELAKPSLSKLLHLAELDILATLRGEITRLAHTKPKLGPKYEEKLREVDLQVKKLGGTDGG